MKWLAQHDNKKAAIEFKNAITSKKDMLPAWRGLAQIEEQDHHWGALIPILQTIVELDPKDLEATLKLGRLFLLAGATDRALNLVNDLDEEASSRASVLALKAAIFYKLNERDRALREAQAALRIDPDNVDAIMVLAADRLDAGDANGALQILENHRGAPMNGLGVDLFKIKVFQQLRELPQIEAVLRKLAGAYPREIIFRQQLVKLYIDQHRLSDAENELRAIAAVDPGRPESILELVRFLNTTKGPAAARAKLLKRISAGGDIFPYQIALAEIDFAQGDYSESTKLLETLAKETSSEQHVVAAKIKLAELNFSIRDVEAASALISDVLKIDSRNIDALKLRASIRITQGQPELAIADLREALNDEPTSADLMMLLASAYERAGLIELARNTFADAWRASNFDANVGLNYVAFLQRRGVVQQAEDVLTEMANRQPKNLTILSALAQAKLARRDWLAAQEIGEKMRGIAEGRSTADQIIGAALGGQGMYRESIAAFEDAVAAEPSAVRPMASLVDALVRAKQTDRAMSFLQTVLKSKPANAEARVLLGTIELKNNGSDQAVKNFMTAIESEPKNNVGYRALADFYLSQKNPGSALKIIRAGLKQQPDDVVLHMALAGILEQIEDYEAAIAEYEYVRKRQPGSMIAANNLASILLDHRTDKTSLKRAESLAISLRQSPVPQFKDTLGWMNFRQGNFKDAVSLLEEAAAALPESASVHYHLGMGYLATGQHTKASREFETALTKSPTDGLRQAIKAELMKMAIR